LSISCIYGIHNIAVDKWYVGQTVHFVSRRKNHLWNLRKSCHNNKHLQASWNKYGESCFEVVCLEKVLPSALVAREQHWINCLKAFSAGYNKAPAAGSCFGVKQSKATIENRVSKLRGRVVASETRAKLSAANTGYRHTEAAKKKMSESCKGRKRSVASIQKQLDTRKRRRTEEGVVACGHKLTWGEVRFIKYCIVEGVPGWLLAKQFCISRPTISDIKYGRSWNE